MSARSPVRVGFDTETALIAPGAWPQLACLTLASEEDLPIFRTNGIDFANSPTRHYVRKEQDGHVLYLVDATLAGQALRQLIDHYGERLLLVSHNAAFDVGVLGRAYPELQEELLALAHAGQISDTMIREMLYCIAYDYLHYDPRIRNKRGTGDPDEGDVVRLALWEPVLARFGVDIREGKTKLSRLEDVPRDQWPWRYRYSELIDIPARDWPREAREYAMDDALWHLKVWYAQAYEGPVDGYPIVHEDTGMYVNEVEQTQASIVFGEMSVGGIRIDPKQAAKFIANVEAKAQESDDAAKQLGILRINRCKPCAGTGRVGTPPILELCPHCLAQPSALRESDSATYSARLREWVSYSFGHEPPMSKPSDRYPKGQVKTDKETLLACGNGDLEAYAKAGAWRKLLSTYVPIVAQAAHGCMLYPVWNVLVNTGRSSCGFPNLQNPPKVGGYRECFVPDHEDWVFCSCDYNSQELVCLAQTALDLLGHIPGIEFKLTEANNRGHDFHLAFWLDHLGITYEEAAARLAAGDPEIKARRQQAKPANFGFPGGMGEATLAVYARGYGLELTPAEAHDLRNNWFAAWPEMRPYMRIFADAACASPDGRLTIQQLPSGRVRGNVSYAEGANSMFQGRGADATKAAMWAVYLECTLGYSHLWTGPGLSPLRGCRLTAAIHDELIVQGPGATAHLWAARLKTCMEQAMQPIVPDQVVRAEAAVMPRWLKAAEYLTFEGRLLVWYPPAPGDRVCKGDITDNEEAIAAYLRAKAAYEEAT